MGREQVWFRSDRLLIAIDKLPATKGMMRLWGPAISPRGDMPKNRVLFTKGASCLPSVSLHTRRHPYGSAKLCLSPAVNVCRRRILCGKLSTQTARPSANE